MPGRLPGQASLVRHRHWTFTIHRRDGEAEDFYLSYYERWGALIDNLQLRYMACQVERCPDTDRLHIQGYCSVTNARTRLGVQRMLSVGGLLQFHCAPRRGTHEEALAYVTKEESRIPDTSLVLGLAPEQGRRRDLEEIRGRLIAGDSLREIAMDHFGDWLRYERGFRSFRAIIREQRDFQTEVIVLWGRSGSGKSRYAWEQGGPDSYWLHNPNSNRCFWDGYDGHESVVIDEFSGWLPYSFMLRLIDRYPMRVETKNGSVPFIAKRIFITSNVCPSRWYRRGLGALRRRLLPPIGRVWRLDHDGEEPQPYELPEDFFGDADEQGLIRAVPRRRLNFNDFCKFTYYRFCLANEKPLQRRRRSAAEPS